MPTEGKLRRMTSKTPYDIYKEAALRKNTRERKAEESSSGLARNSASLSFQLILVQLIRVLVWARRSRAHLS